MAFKSEKKNSSWLLLAFFMLFCFYISPPVVFGEGHLFFECNGGTDSCGRATAEDWHESCDDQGNCTSYRADYYTCDSWQKCQDTGSYMRCYCNADCLEYPKADSYYDNPDPKSGRTAQNKQNINLPVALAWDNIPGWSAQSFSSPVEAWKNLGQGKTSLDSGCSRVSNYTEKGPKSYIIEIQDDPSTPGTGIDNMNLPGSAKIVTADGRSAFQKLIKINQFNSRSDGGECFFNTNSTYRWRVYPCCDEDGTSCANANGAQWFTFKTSPAPEPLYPYDPDWNGPLAAGESGTPKVDFCNAKMQWCKAKLVPNDQKSEYSKHLNDGQLDYAANYQIRFKYDENWKLEIINTSGSIFDSISSFFSNPAAYLANSLNSLLKQASENIPGTDKNNRESCVYLERQIDGKGNVTGCKPEAVNFSVAEIDEEKTPGFKPFFSSQQKISDRSVFTGGLKYSWQTKSCFNSATINSCNYYAEYNGADYNEYEKKLGQKWKFITEVKKIAAPELLTPENNPSYNEKKLVGVTKAITWSVPCGAHSFIYDIQKVDSNNHATSIFTADSGFPADQGRRITTGQVLVALTDKSVAKQGNEMNKVILELDKNYQWRVRSCWPSIPVGDTSGASPICNDWNSSWKHFRTTGRIPNDLRNTNDSAPRVTFSWESVPEYGSFNIKIKDVAGNEIPLKTPNPQKTNSYVFEYDQSRTSYYWQVRTCADVNGNVCGDWSALQPYTSKDFEKPTNFNPSSNIDQLPPAITWSSPAKSFQILFTYSPKDASGECQRLAVVEKRSVVGTASCSASNGCLPAQLQNYICPGDYKISVLPCFNSDCTKTSSASQTAEQAFAVGPNAQKKSGLMVCGLKENYLDTPWDDTEKCGVIHIFLLAQKLIGWAIFWLSFIFLPISGVLTGIMFFISEDKAKIIPTIKGLWQKVGIGYVILFFAWLIVTLIMQLSGYGYNWTNPT